MILHLFAGLRRALMACDISLWLKHWSSLLKRITLLNLFFDFCFFFKCLLFRTGFWGCCSFQVQWEVYNRFCGNWLVKQERWARKHKHHRNSPGNDRSSPFRINTCHHDAPRVPSLVYDYDGTALYPLLSISATDLLCTKMIFIILAMCIRQWTATFTHSDHVVAYR